MRILVIGGIAFIGRQMVQRLVARGHDVSVLHRRDHHDLGPAVHNLQANRRDLETVGRFLREHDFEVVYDNAYDWEHGTTAEEVLGVARQCRPGLHRYVFMSSIAAYGEGSDRGENDPLAPDDHPNPYVRNKAASERALFRLHREAGLPVVTFRPPFVHGPGQPFYREQFFWDRIRDGRPIILPDGGDRLMQWVYVADLAEACVRAIEVPAAVGEAFNVAYQRPISQRDFVVALGRVAGIEPGLVPIPRERIEAAGGHAFVGHLYFGEYLDIPPITEVIEKATRVLGVKLTGFEEALRASYTWYQTQPRRPVDYAFEDRLLG
ncbi:MAG TPA: NAD-dependent epimerase/dehydratase family protein [Gemmatimonadales bacterium]|nr:NAD-dependent epimerase/dehydratase family protein [Gemmatimonadales bacterium]